MSNQSGRDEDGVDDGFSHGVDEMFERLSVSGACEVVVYLASLTLVLRQKLIAEILLRNLIIRPAIVITKVFRNGRLQNLVSEYVRLVQEENHVFLSEQRHVDCALE